MKQFFRVLRIVRDWRAVRSFHGLRLLPSADQLAALAASGCVISARDCKAQSMAILLRLRNEHLTSQFNRQADVCSPCANQTADFWCVGRRGETGRSPNCGRRAGKSGERPIIVFEFWSPPGSNGAGSEFERSLSLARFLTGPSMQRIRTVAFVSQSAATGHAVLVALACEQIIMDPDAVLGKVQAKLSQRSDRPCAAATPKSRGRGARFPEAIALGMLDADLEISRVQTDTGALYTWAEELELGYVRQRNDLQSVETDYSLPERSECVPRGRAARIGIRQPSGNQRRRNRCSALGVLCQRTGIRSIVGRRLAS